MSHKYEVTAKVLGQGGFGEVVLGRVRATGKNVAIKTLQMTKDGGDIVRREIEIMSKLSRHPNILKLVDTYDTDAPKRCYIVTEYIDGGDLAAFLGEHGPLDERTAWYYLTQIAAGLHHVHIKHKTLHRDIKPANMMLAMTDTGLRRLLLADFGLSRPMPLPGQPASTVCGTYAYMAPEMLKGEVNGDTRSCDIWSVGVTLYEMLIGEPPWSNRNDRWEQHDVVTSTSTLLQTSNPVSAECRALLKQLLQVSPTKRISADRFYEHDYLREYTVLQTRSIALDAEGARANIIVSPMDNIRDLERMCIAAYKKHWTDVNISLAGVGFKRDDLLTDHDLLKPGRVVDVCTSAMGCAIPKAAPAPPSPVAATGYESYTVAVLKAMCDKRNIGYKSNITRPQLIALLEADDKEPQKPPAASSSSSSSSSTSSTNGHKKSIKKATEEELLAADITPAQAISLIAWRDKSKPLIKWEDVKKATRSEVARGKLEKHFSL